MANQTIEDTACHSASVWKLLGHQGNLLARLWKNFHCGARFFCARVSLSWHKGCCCLCDSEASCADIEHAEVACRAESKHGKRDQIKQRKKSCVCNRRQRKVHAEKWQRDRVDSHRVCPWPPRKDRHCGRSVGCRPREA